MSSEQCRVKSGTPAVVNGEGMEGEITPNSSPGKVQATVGGAIREREFSTPVRTGVAGAGPEFGAEGAAQQHAFAQSPQAHVVETALLAGAWAITIACAPASSRLASMATTRFI